MSLLTRFFIVLWFVLSASYVKANMPPALVKTALVQSNSGAQTVWRNGQVISRNNSKVASRVTGQVVWLADIGDYIKQGEVLVKLDKSQIEHALAQQNAVLRQHEAQLVFLKQEVSRLETLAAQNNTSKTLLEQRFAELQKVQAEIDAAQSMLASLTLDREYTDLIAPFSGVVSERFTQVGQVVNRADPLVRLVDTVQKDIQVMVPLISWQNLKPGMLLKVQSVFGDAELKIRKVVPVGHHQTRLMQVFLSAETLTWPVGVAVNVAVPLPEILTAAAFLVPRDALVLRKGNTSVFVIDENNIAKQVNVLETFGIGQDIAVSGELKVGQKVVVRGAERLRTGAAVQDIGGQEGLVKVRGHGL